MHPCHCSRAFRRRGKKRCRNSHSASLWRKSNQDYKSNGMEENKCGGEWEQLWESDMNAQANTIIETEESQYVPATTTYFLQKTLGKKVKSDKEEIHVKEDSSVSTTVVKPQISTDVSSWMLNLIDEVKSLKESQLKRFVKINMLEKRLVKSSIPIFKSKQEVQQLKNRIGTLEHGSQPVVDPVEVDDHVSIKSQSNFDASMYIVGGFLMHTLVSYQSYLRALT
ncbi:hypothetical protein Tco_1390016 [Tanacetum coccineum]